MGLSQISSSSLTDRSTDRRLARLPWTQIELEAGDMSELAMRDLLLRAQRDLAFAEQVRTDPDGAAAGYDLSDEELDSLRRLDRSLYRHLVSAHRLAATGAILLPQPPDEEDVTMPDLTAPATTLPDLSQLTLHGLVTIVDQVARERERRRADAMARQEQVDEIRAASGPERRAKLEVLLEEFV